MDAVAVLVEGLQVSVDPVPHGVLLAGVLLGLQAAADDVGTAKLVLKRPEVSWMSAPTRSGRTRRQSRLMTLTLVILSLDVPSDPDTAEMSRALAPLRRCHRRGGPIEPQVLPLGTITLPSMERNRSCRYSDVLPRAKARAVTRMPPDDGHDEHLLSMESLSGRRLIALQTSIPRADKRRMNPE